MAEIFTIPQNTTRPKLEVQLWRHKASGVAYDLSQASGVELLMWPAEGGAFKVEASAGIQAPAASGLMLYTWQAADTDTVGEFAGAARITLQDGGIEIVPNDDTFTIVVRDVGPTG